jgi:hypothetical protein
MAAIVNDKDKILQATAVRLPASLGNYIYFSNVSPVFKVNVSGVSTPNSYSIEANFSGQITGVVTWSVISGSISSTSGQAGNTWTITADQLTSTTAVIRATLEYLGAVYTNEFTISKVSDGLPGAPGVDGAPGVSPVLVTLLGQQAVTYQYTGTTPAPAFVTFTAQGKNVGSTTHYYRFKIDNVTLGTIKSSNTGTAVSDAYSLPALHFEVPKSILVEISANADMSTVLAAASISLVAIKEAVPGANGVKSTSGYIYFSNSQTLVPASPTATSFNFATGTFTGLTSNWSTGITMTGNGTYWSARYVVTESAFGTNTGTPSFSTPFTHQNFSGLVTFTDATNIANTSSSNAVSDRPTFTNLATAGQTTIHGGSISTGTISVDRITAGTTTTQNNITFGFGIGTVIQGIQTAGFFKSNSGSAAGLAAFANYNVALACTTSSTGSAAALFSNTYGNFDSISPTHVVVGASIAHGASQAGLFTQRRNPNVSTPSETGPNSGTSAYARLAFLSGSDSYGAQLMSTTTSGADSRGITAGGPTYGLTVLGGTSPFTGCHDGLLDKVAMPEPGDILVDTGIVVAKVGVGDTLTQVALSASANQKGVIGVYVSKNTDIPHILKISTTRETIEHDVSIQVVDYKLDPQFEQVVATHDFVAINSLGEGQINVCGEAGTIELGDLIVTSSVPGKGMRQSDDVVRSVTVAKARETVVFDSPTQVKQIACIYMCG